MADDLLQVSIPARLRPKVERMARGSGRSLSNVIAVLVELADETDPMWNIVPRGESQEAQRGQDGRDGAGGRQA